MGSVLHSHLASCAPSYTVLPISRALKSSGVSFASSQEMREEKECGGLCETLGS